MKQMTAENLIWKIFRVPLAIGLVSIIGLIAALTGDGWFDALSWLTLAVPPVVVLWAIIR